MVTPAPMALNQDAFAEAVKNPLALLHPAIRPMAFQVWAFTRHLAGLETAFAIAAPLAPWIELGRLMPSEAVSVLARMQTPELMRTYRFASDVTSTLADLVYRVRGAEMTTVIYDPIPTRLGSER